ncbi:MAG: hypothetical protein O2910_05985 [Proteobacteria bacterium]|nr:hypothetical protein [Pseudomonadota bacterium]
MKMLSSIVMVCSLLLAACGNNGTSENNDRVAELEAALRAEQEQSEALAQ